MRADVSRAEHEHVRSGGRRNLAEVVPLVAMLQVAVAGELLHDGEDLCKEVLRDRLAVGARCAAEHGACRQRARGRVFVVSRGVQLNKLQVGSGVQPRGGEVAHDNVGGGDLFVRRGLDARVRELRVRRSALELGFVLLARRNQYQDVHLRLL